jgi:hypothetical protein
MTSTCLRCGNLRKLTQSHVLPEGAYRPIYDEKSRALRVQSDRKIVQPVQTGVWQYMFCQACEDFFNKIETPFLNRWRRPDSLPSNLYRPFVELSGLDYEVTKRFLLSVLWRAHVSSRPEVVAVDIGSHADRIRALLDSPSPIPETTYPVFGYVLRNADGSRNDRIVSTPAKTRTDGHWNYLIVRLSCAWRIFVSSRPQPLPRSCMLKTNGTIVMPVTEAGQFPMIRSVLNPRGGN